MTIEELSHATADRYAAKMMHDVKSNSRIRAPPRPAPPQFAREALDDATSARVVEDAHVEDLPKEPVVSARPATRDDDVQAFFDAFQKVESSLHTYVTPEDRKRIRDSLSSPTGMGDNPLQNPMVVTVLVCSVLVAIVYQACQPTGRYRSSTTPVASAFEGDSSMAWSISRILRPFASRPH